MWRGMKGKKTPESKYRVVFAVNIKIIIQKIRL